MHEGFCKWDKVSRHHGYTITRHRTPLQAFVEWLAFWNRGGLI